jgi:hypothetical protein
MAQRIMQYQAVIQLAQGAPQIYNLPVLHRQMIEVLGIKNAEKLVPTDDDQTPRDPVSENMSFLTGKPTKAFIFQDHDAHIAVHQSMMQDPVIMGQLGQNPMAQQMQGAIMAHISEHLAFSYRSKVEEQLGVPLPAPDAELPPDIEVQLSKVIAQAAQQLKGINQQKAQQEQAQQQAQDPALQLQQQALQVQAQDVKRKEIDDQRDFEIAQRKLELENKRIDVDAAKEASRLQTQDRQNKDRIASQNYQSNQKMSIDVLKAKTPQNNQQ